MQQEEILGTTSVVDNNCMALYVVAKRNGMSIPEPNIHYYLAGILSRSEKPVFVVNSVAELEKVVIENNNKPEPNAVPYLVSQNSGDFFLNLNTFGPVVGDLSFSKTCYSFASYFGKKIGRKTELSIFNELLFETERYAQLFVKLHQSEFEGLEITDFEYRAFKDYFYEIDKARTKPLVQPIKKNIKRDILI
jgi:hypothetical protein